MTKLTKQARKTEYPNRVYLDRQKCRSCGDTYDAGGLRKGSLDGYCGMCILGVLDRTIEKSRRSERVQ